MEEVELGGGEGGHFFFSCFRLLYLVIKGVGVGGVVVMVGGRWLVLYTLASD